MKLRIFLVLAFVSVLAVSLASAQFEALWTADIPFDFIVGDNHMPAGRYMIKSDPQTMRLSVININTRQTAFVFTRNVEELAKADRTELIFVQEGDRHVLHQVWRSGDGHGHDIVHGTEVIELTKTK